ncbi:hem-binding uptake, Tiki superfamily, chaN domain containing protein [Nitzschia inconspicua]|uniref:Hem-binding uptake, Tiki superfamily, chaN domain containing protein n=1 Tax=Nitzschia inconspicua TaxID=303405 RepID=A0A9K3LJT1_9STRA|nr:hem-binding uptake, Tiki superfamily, chaN domain containing protein [Nitzschia inconspicua]
MHCIGIVLLLAVLQSNPSFGFMQRSCSRNDVVLLLTRVDDGASGKDDRNVQSVRDDTSNNDLSTGSLSRRSALQRSVEIVSLITTAALGSRPAMAADSTDNGFIPATRPTAYRVDSTQPPTLIPLANARKENQVLRELGNGSGTDKNEIVDDSVNLNNMLNKAVFGSIDAVSSLIGSKKDESKVGPGYASFVCMGLPAATTSVDIDLAASLLTPIVQSRNKDTALGLFFCPMSAQSALDSYSQSGDENALKASIKESGVDDGTMDLYMPLLKVARQHSLQLLALSPEVQDIESSRKNGLQSISPERRQQYVADPQGFISVTQDPRYKLYTDRSLLKDFTAVSKDDKATGFFAERILVHETAATVAAKYAVMRPESLVTIVAHIPDVRFLLGINGRIPRVCAALNSQRQVPNKVTDNAVTTILLNPTASETLSASRYLRLEIGTGPETLEYQTKVADYLWFSSSPKVNLIPRLMNA